MSPLALLVLIASASLAEDPDYRTAIELYENVEFEQALFRFQSAAVRPDLNDAERAELFLWIGLCYGNIGDLESAERQFRDGLQLFPSAPLPQPNTSPIIIDLFKEVKAEVQRTLTAATPPPGQPADDESAPQGDDDAGDEVTLHDEGASGGLPWMLISGGAVAAGGAVLLLAAGVGAGASYLVFAQGLAMAEDNTVFGSDIKNLELAANVLLGGAVAVGALGALIVIAGGATAGASFLVE